MTASESTSAENLRTRVADVGFWWHSIDLGDGVVTPGAKSSAWLEAELARLELGDLRGKSVLDIGAYDGFYSFAAERLGAERVVALDHYVWSADMPGYMAYRDRQMAAGLAVEPVETLPEFWRPDELPGRRPFDLAHEALGSRVEVVVGDLLDYDLSELGSFDVVLYLGVLYHVRHPLLALEKLAALTRGTAYIETQAEVFRGSEAPADVPVHRRRRAEPRSQQLVDVQRRGPAVDVPGGGLRASRDQPRSRALEEASDRPAARFGVVSRRRARERMRDPRTVKASPC